MADTLDGERSDLFALQDRITARIANSIGREVVVVAARESESRKSDPNTVELLMRGIAIADKPFSLETLQQQEELFRKVFATEPTNVEAMAQLARTLSLEGYALSAFLPPQIAQAKLEEANTRTRSDGSRPEPQSIRIARYCNCSSAPP